MILLYKNYIRFVDEKKILRCVSLYNLNEIYHI